jgi:hypothetical protein
VISAWWLLLIVPLAFCLGVMYMAILIRARECADTTERRRRQEWP